MTEGTESGLPTASQLVELVHHYLPANIWESELGYGATPEYQRLKAARSAAAETGKERWKAFLARLREEVPQCKVEDWTILISDNCWRVRLLLPDRVPVEGGGEEFRYVVGLVSIFAPVAATYTSFKQRIAEHRWRPSQTFYEPVPATREYEEVLVRLLCEELGAPRLPNETLFTPVPDIQYRCVAMKEARLIDCLFTDDRW
ncbi:hypothetical protein JQX13_06975 [Archangium violaceum]|uniref:hypothetical protein n=1 Tax=Archangium violaceum TaxID=83451 RepID=UPI00193B1599|nr:hypothetical protein [Archangium violaceum]QRK09845.1 hypothetical protein JQX13_06975 [Archangium violaceum]